MALVPAGVVPVVIFIIPAASLPVTETKVGEVPAPVPAAVPGVPDPPTNLDALSEAFPDVSATVPDVIGKVIVTSAAGAPGASLVKPAAAELDRSRVPEVLLAKPN